MRARNLLHRSKLQEFKTWLYVAKGIQLLEPKGHYEVVRWKNKPGKPMCIVYDRHEGDHYTTNSAAYPYVRQFINDYRDKDYKLAEA